MRIGRAIAIQTLVISLGIILIAASTLVAWLRIDAGQKSVGEDSLILHDFRLLEDTINAWLLSNGLIYGSGQTYLVGGARRQTEQAIKLAQTIRESALGASASTQLLEIMEQLRENQAHLEVVQYLSAEADPREFRSYLHRWDQLSPRISSLLIGLEQQLALQAQTNSETLSRQRNLVLQIAVLCYLLFGFVVFGLWRWLTRLLVAPLTELTHAADNALLAGKSLDLESAGPPELKQLASAINAFIQSLEDHVAERTRALEEQKQKLVSEIDRRKEAELIARRSARQANAANREKSRFLANMSHEIRTPLNGIIGSADLLLKDPSPDKVNRGLSIIQNSGDHLLELINQVLDFSKIEAGQLALDKSVFSLDDLLLELRSIFLAQASEKNIEFIFDIDPQLPPNLQGDALRIKQILTNLLGNAFVYTNQGMVLLRASLGSVKAGKSIEIAWEVQDTGIGISPERQGDIFNSFQQADSGTTRKYGGTGLGLTISQQLAKLMGGRIELDSQTGMGSTFRCYMLLELPASSPAERPPLAAGHALMALGNRWASDQMKRYFTAWGWSTSEVPASVDGAVPEEATVIVLEQRQRADYVALSRAAREKGLDFLVLGKTFDDAPAREQILDHEFVISLPLIPGEMHRALQAIQSDQQAPTSREAASPRFSGHVLVVEDNPVNQEVTRSMLEILGVTVTIAEDGLQAVQFMEAGSADLILMDWHMPVMDGVTATRKIREQEKSRNCEPVPIIVFTADTQKEQIQVCFEAGVDAYLCKPVKLNELRETLLTHFT